MVAAEGQSTQCCCTYQLVRDQSMQTPFCTDHFISMHAVVAVLCCYVQLNMQSVMDAHMWLRVCAVMVVSVKIR